MNIQYGINGHLLDVTAICEKKLLNRNNCIIIPSGDVKRAVLFSDPFVGVKKKIFITTKNGVNEYDDSVTVKIEKSTCHICVIDENDIDEKISNLHATLNINHGTLNEELPEQRMAVRYLKGNERVLEIGGNIGRNSLIIASLLENSRNLVTLESDIRVAEQLKENRNLNGLHFHVECSALSKRKLMQNGWDTMPGNTLQPGYSWVNTITYSNLKKKYMLAFDTLILDCEGAFYYILMDMPEVLSGVKLIIMENDYKILDHKHYVDDVLRENNFRRDYVEQGGWGHCFDNFFEVWIR
jgi:FkbM family methyltransferase